MKVLILQSNNHIFKILILINYKIKTFCLISIIFNHSKSYMEINL